MQLTDLYPELLAQVVEDSFEAPDLFPELQMCQPTFVPWAKPAYGDVLSLSLVCKAFAVISLPIRFRCVHCDTWDQVERFYRLVDKNDSVANAVRYLLLPHTPEILKSTATTVVPLLVRRLTNLVGVQVLNYINLQHDALAIFEV